MVRANVPNVARKKRTYIRPGLTNLCTGSSFIVSSAFSCSHSGQFDTELRTLDLGKFAPLSSIRIV